MYLIYATARVDILCSGQLLMGEYGICHAMLIYVHGAEGVMGFCCVQEVLTDFHAHMRTGRVVVVSGALWKCHVVFVSTPCSY